jgi:hypothetical protein
MNVYIQRNIDENWEVWIGETPDGYRDDVAIFHPGDKGGYCLDAYSYAKTLADELGCELREVPQPR